jgi:hypothetical protein
MKNLTDGELQTYYNDFKKKISSDNKVIDGFHFDEDYHTGCLCLEKEDFDITIYCDPFWESENSQNDEIFDKIQIELNESGNVVVSKYYDFLKTFDISTDVQKFYFIMENYISKDFKHDMMKLKTEVKL